MAIVKFIEIQNGGNPSYGGNAPFCFQIGGKSPYGGCPPYGGGPPYGEDPLYGESYHNFRCDCS